MLAVLWLSAAALAQALPVVGDGENLWIVLGTDDSTHILQRSELDDANRVFKAPAMPGRLTPGGVAAGDDCLWLVSEKRTVQSMAIDAHPDPGRLPFGPLRMEQQLPQHEALLAFGAVASGPWALLRVEDQASLDRIDSGLTEAEAAARADTQPSASQPATQRAAAGAVRADRLVRLEQNRWEKADLPEDWPGRGKAWIVAESIRDDRPLLLARPTAGAPELWIYRAADKGWNKTVHKLDSRGDIIPLGVDGQLILARPAAGKSKGVTLDLLIVRPEGIHRFGSISLGLEKDSAWGVAPAGQTIALVAAQGKKLRWTRRNLMNEELTPPSPLEEREAQSLFDRTGLPLQFIMMGLALILIMSLVWRRGGDAGKITVPEGFESADLVRRCVAALIDLAIPAAVVVYFWQVQPGDLAARWYSATPTWETIQPNLVVIGLLILHTTISELFTARTLGKVMLGLRVMSVDGKPPNIWQVLARNLLKSFDLLAWPLLVLPLVRPHGQRLGDIVARTLVVTPVSPDSEDQDEG